MLRSNDRSRELDIRIRNIRFECKSPESGRWWHGNDPVPTAFFNALSCTFPEGERFFMESVRHYRDVVPPKLRDQIKAFLGQEAVHSREHAAFNERARESGYQVERLEMATRRTLAVARSRSPVDQLAATCGLEHFTAILAHALLKSDSCDMIGAPKEITKMWSWHAIEEIEHKAVAYDTFLHATKSWSPLRRYAKRVGALLLATVILFYRVGANMAALYREDGINTPRTWARTISYLLGRPGIIRRILPQYFHYYMPGFHPWDVDDRSLVTRTLAKYDLVSA